VKTVEKAPQYEIMPDFGMEAFGINDAFQEAISGVASDTELAVEQKIRIMEVIVNEGTSEIYRDFIDFRQMAAQLEMFCNHDHDLDHLIRGNETLSDFMKSFKANDEHEHDNSLHNKEDEDEEYEVNPYSGKKKKRHKWLSLLLKWLNKRAPH
jgi:hypothetical protein